MRAPREKEEAKMECPVCKGETKVSEYKEEIGMCWRCHQYLAPERGGKDFGSFMFRVDEGPSGERRAEYRPRGFWSDSINVRESRDFWTPKPGESVKWTVEISWGTGGRDGSLDSIREVENFIRALEHATMLAKVWKMERATGLKA